MPIGWFSRHATRQVLRVRGPKRRPVWRGRSFTRVPEHFWWRTGRWVSDAAVKLTARAFAELNEHPEIGRDEASRISMKELIEKGDFAEAHPREWARFVIVGEAAASR